MNIDCLTTPIDHLEATLEHGILTLAINRPEAKNALYTELYLAIEQALYQADQNNEVRTVVLRGLTNDFTAGNDMQDFARSIRHPITPAGQGAPFLLLKSVARFSKPLIIGVKGVAIGIGVTLLLHADFVYTDNTALFQIPFVSLGLSPEGCASKLLKEQAGHLLAADLILSARRFDAATALQARLVTAIVDDPYQQSYQMAAHLSNLPLSSLRTSKALMKNNLEDIINWIDHEAEIFMQRVASPEMQEALIAFKEKRKADFTKFN